MSTENTQATTTPLLKINGLCKTIKDTQILNSVDLEVYKGDVIILTGLPGCGKSTLFKCLRLPSAYPPDAGKIYFDNELFFKNERTQLQYQIETLKEQEDYDKAELNALKKKFKTIKKEEKSIDKQRESKHASYRWKFGLTLQNFALYPHMTVLDNLTFVNNTQKVMSKKEAQDKAMALLKKFGLDSKANEKAKTLPPLERQFVHLLRPLIFDFKLLLLDEPLSDLSPEESEKVVNLIKDLSQERKTIIIATNNITPFKEIANRFVVLECGVLKEEQNLEKTFKNATELD